METTDMTVCNSYRRWLNNFREFFPEFSLKRTTKKKTTLKYTRRAKPYIKKQILKALYENKGMSINEIAKKTGIKESTVRYFIKELVEEGVIEEIPPRRHTLYRKISKTRR